MVKKVIDNEPMLEEASDEVLLEETSGKEAMLEETSDSEMLLEEDPSESVLLEEDSEVLLEEATDKAAAISAILGSVKQKAEEKTVETDSADEKPSTDKPAEEKPTEDTAEEKPAEEPVQPDWKDRYARAMADFDNFRKRTARDREDLVKFAASDVIKAMLPTVDNLFLALEKAKDRADDPFVTGVKLVYDGLIKALADQGATPLDSVGEPFDANFHDALAQLPSPDVEEGVVMNEVKRGWLLHGKLLRPAQVVVSAGKGA